MKENGLVIVDGRNPGTVWRQIAPISFSIGSMAYFFANQGSSFDFLRDEGYMFTTYLDRDGVTSPNVPPLQNMAPGDTVIINLDGLVGIASVISKVPDFPMTKEFAFATNILEGRFRRPESAQWMAGMKGLRVNAAYEPLPSKIRYQDFAQQILKAQAESPKLRQPFDVHGNANQGTFYWLDIPLARVLLEIIGRPLPAIPGLLSSPAETVGPYVAKFTSREIRPEQSAFRDLMLKTWKKCPVTGIQNPALLDAAHFEDWRHHNDESAGMLLNPLIHRAVDREIMEIKLDPSFKKWRIHVLVKDDPYINQFDRMEFPNPLAVGDPLKTRVAFDDCAWPI